LSGRQTIVSTLERRHRLVWLIGARVVVSTLLLGSAVAFQINAPGSLPIDPFFFLIGLTYALSVIYAMAVPFVARHPWIVDLQFACDALTITAFIHFTGGVTSYFQLLYVLPVAGASSMQLRRGGLRVAAVSALIYSALVMHQYFGGPGYVNGAWVHDVRLLLPPPRVAEYTVATNALAFVAVALLGGSLADRLRRADAQLAVASSALADLQAFNQHVIESLTSGLVTTDRAGRIVTFNRAAEVISGHTAAAVIGLPAPEVLQLPAEFSGLLAVDLGGAPARRADYRYIGVDGATREIGLSATHLVTPDGRAGYLLTFQDVTEMRRLEQEARRRQRLAAVGEMAAGIAHEIRNPLASMRGSIQVLRAELSLSDEQASLMDIVLRESDRLNATIRSFLTYARPQPAAREAVDLARVCSDVASLLRNSPELRPTHRIDVDMPAGGLLLEADGHQIHQVVWNLATNGLRAMPEGGRLRLTGHPTSGTGDVVLDVSDEGVGISADQLERLFQPFHGSFGQGCGLGLAIVHRIVTDHSGTIRIDSEPGKGTCVAVQLPRGTVTQVPGGKSEPVYAD
jgi:two-component system sensor histidine kinase PilS (NtrC family)